MIKGIRSVSSFGNPKFPSGFLVGMVLKVLWQTWMLLLPASLRSSAGPGADPGVNQQVGGGGVSGVAVPTPLSPCPAESRELELCGGVCVCVCACYLRLLAVWVVCVLSVCEPSGCRTPTAAQPSIANRFIKPPMRWLCSRFIPSIKETLYDIWAQSNTHTHRGTSALMNWSRSKCQLNLMLYLCRIFWIAAKTLESKMPN